MELEDLKHQWQQADQIHKPKNKDIMEMIQHESYGPVAALKRSFRKQMIAMTVVPYFQNFRMLNTWHSLSPFIRFGAYAGLFLFQYFLSRRISDRKFGQPIARLKELVKQME